MLATLACLALAQGRILTLGFQDDSGKWGAPLDSKKTTVFFFILKDCPISRKYSLEMKRLAKDYPSVTFYSVHADPADTVADAAKHRKEFGLPFASLLDPRGRLVRLAEVTTVPTAAVYGADRAWKYVGRIDDRFPALGVEREKPQRRDLRIALDEVLAGKPVSVARTPVIGCVVPKG